MTSISTPSPLFQFTFSEPALPHLTGENISNLDMLATYLECLPTNYDHFSMQTFYQKPYPRAALVDGEVRMNFTDGELPCGSAACALGHGPAAGIQPRHEDFDAYMPEGVIQLNWESYCGNFIALEEDLDSLSKILWTWLFGVTWMSIDDTHQGAAARIRYVLDGQSIPVETDLMVNRFSEVRKEALRELYAPYLKQPA